MTRELLLAASLVPYASFGLRDVLHHSRYRPTPWPERLLHGGIGLSLAIAVPHAFERHPGIAIAGLILFGLCRALDEFGFHRGLPAAESDLHAKTHFSFLLFLVTWMLLDSPFSVAAG